MVIDWTGLDREEGKAVGEVRERSDSTRFFWSKAFLLLEDSKGIDVHLFTHPFYKCLVGIS